MSVVQSGTGHYQVHVQTGNFVGMSGYPLPPASKGHTGRKYYELDTGIVRICTGRSWEIWHREQPYILSPPTQATGTLDFVADGTFSQASVLIEFEPAPGHVSRSTLRIALRTNLAVGEDGNGWRLRLTPNSQHSVDRENRLINISYNPSDETISLVSSLSTAPELSQWILPPVHTGPRLVFNTVVVPDQDLVFDGGTNYARTVASATVTIEESKALYEAGNDWTFNVQPTSASVSVSFHDANKIVAILHSVGAQGATHSISTIVQFLNRLNGFSAQMSGSDATLDTVTVVPRRHFSGGNSAPTARPDPEDVPAGAEYWEPIKGYMSYASHMSWVRARKYNFYASEGVADRPSAAELPEGTRHLDVTSGQFSVVHRDGEQAEWHNEQRMQPLVVQSGDTRPAHGDYPIGTPLYESDTGWTYVNDGGSWRRLPRMDPILGSPRPQVGSVPEGTEHYDHDSGDYRFNDGGTWRLAPRVAPYVGLSSEIKPNYVPEGTRYFERDTGDMYYYDAAGVWRREIRREPLVGRSSQTKPTTNVPVGQRLIESDTGDQFYWSGTSWVRAPLERVLHDNDTLDPSQWPPGTMAYDPATGWHSINIGSEFAELPRQTPIPYSVTNTSARPAANTVPVGTRYLLRERGIIYISDGTDWRIEPRDGISITADRRDNLTAFRDFPDGTIGFASNFDAEYVSHRGAWLPRTRGQILVGTSSITKPTGNEVAAGQQFYETDTEQTYAWSGSSWERYKLEVTGIGGGGGGAGSRTRIRETGIRPDDSDTYTDGDAVTLQTRVQTHTQATAEIVFDVNIPGRESEPHIRVTVTIEESRAAGTAGNDWQVRLDGSNVTRVEPRSGLSPPRLQIFYAGSARLSDIVSLINAADGFSAQVDSGDDRISVSSGSFMETEIDFSGGATTNTYRNRALDWQDVPDDSRIKSVIITTDRAGWDRGFRLHLFSAPPPAGAIPDDNDAFSVGNGVTKDHYLGRIDMPAPQLIAGDASATTIHDLDIPIETDATDRLWGLLQVIGGDAAAASEQNFCLDIVVEHP